MGIVARIVVYAEAEIDAREGAKAAFERIEVLEGIFSNYRADSEVGRLARAPAGLPLRVSPELFLVMQRADLLWRESGGAFDAAVGPLTDLWREAIARGVLPDSSEIARARMASGWKHVTLDASARTVTLDLAGLSLDFGAIAKGYAADEAIRVLRERGLSRALVELGGDIVVGDAPPNREGWKIDGSKFGATDELVVSNVGISTSGDSQQHVFVDGIRYSHIVDPRTGFGLTTRSTVTVVAPDGLTSDGLSTTVSVMGEAAGRPLALSLRANAHVIASEAKQSP